MVNVRKSSFCFVWWPWKGPVGSYVFDGQMKALNLRIRTGCVLASWGHRQHPWRWQSSSWRVRCRWRHPWWRSQGKPWGLHGSPHRSGQRYAWLLHGEPNAWWRAWWFPGCCLSTPYGDAWRLPCRVPFLLCRVQSCCLVISKWCLDPQTVLDIRGCRPMVCGHLSCGGWLARGLRHDTGGPKLV